MVQKLIVIYIITFMFCGCCNYKRSNSQTSAEYKHINQTFRIVEKFPNFKRIKEGMTFDECQQTLGVQFFDKNKLSEPFEYCDPRTKGNIYRRLTGNFCSIREAGQKSFLLLDLYFIEDKIKNSLVFDSSESRVVSRTDKELALERHYLIPESRDKNYYKFKYKLADSPVSIPGNKYENYFIVKELPDVHLLKKEMPKSEADKIVGEPLSHLLQGIVIEWSRTKYKEGFSQGDFFDAFFDNIPDGVTVEFPGDTEVSEEQLDMIEYETSDLKFTADYCVKNKESIDFLELFICFEYRLNPRTDELHADWPEPVIYSIEVKKFSKTYKEIEKEKRDKEIAYQNRYNDFPSAIRPLFRAKTKREGYSDYTEALKLVERNMSAEVVNALASRMHHGSECSYDATTILKDIYLGEDHFFEEKTVVTNFMNSKNNYQKAMTFLIDTIGKCKDEWALRGVIDVFTHRVYDLNIVESSTEGSSPNFLVQLESPEVVIDISFDPRNFNDNFEWKKQLSDKDKLKILIDLTQEWARKTLSRALKEENLMLNPFEVLVSESDE